jgi:hypothetical protein
MLMLLLECEGGLLKLKLLHRDDQEETALELARRLGEEECLLYLEAAVQESRRAGETDDQLVRGASA